MSIISNASKATSSANSIDNFISALNGDALEQINAANQLAASLVGLVSPVLGPAGAGATISAAPGALATQSAVLARDSADALSDGLSFSLIDKLLGDGLSLVGDATIIGEGIADAVDAVPIALAYRY